MKLFSVIIPTIGRATLTRAVESVLSQGFDPGQYEIIVVNDSGQPQAVVENLSAENLISLTTNHSERSMARNVGAAVATGKYLHFLDDDDYVLPGGLVALVRVAEASQASWIYGGVLCVDEIGAIQNRIQPQVDGNLFARLISGDSIPLGASLIRRDMFMRTGGFDPLLDCLEDRDIECRFALIGEFDHANEVVACYRVAHASTTTAWSKLPWSNRVLREKALDTPGALARMIGSAGADAFWHGRGCRTYLASAATNVRQHNYCGFLPRLLASVYVAGLYWLNPEFWQGLWPV